MIASTAYVRKTSESASCSWISCSWISQLGMLQCKSLLPATACVTGPTNYGTTAEAGTPWLQLALYTSMQAGPLSIVLVCGQRIWRLPPHLATCTHALLWPWNLDAVRAQVPCSTPCPVPSHHDCLYIVDVPGHRVDPNCSVGQAGW